MTSPIVFLTDHGLADEFVRILHGVIARIAPGYRLRAQADRPRGALRRSARRSRHRAAVDGLGGARRRGAAVEIHSAEVVLQSISRTFHGRDVFAPAAAWLAEGRSLEELRPPVRSRSSTRELPRPVIAPGIVGARVTGVDAFGNVQLNVRPAELEAAGLGPLVTLGVREIPRTATFADVSNGACAAIVDSQGYVALVVNRGSAANLLGLSVGDAVVIGS